MRPHHLHHLLRMLPVFPVLLCVLICLLAAVPACSSAGLGSSSVPPAAGPTSVRAAGATDGYELPVAHAPFRDVVVNYKERLDQPYVFVEVRGDPAQAGRALPGLFAAMKRLGVEPSGPPFALYYGDRRSAQRDDRPSAAAAEFVSRACVPVDVQVTLPGLAFDILPCATVSYALVAGEYPRAHAVYDPILAFARRMSWRPTWPVREIYLVSPAAVASFEDLVCEVQIPVGDAR